MMQRLFSSDRLNAPAPDETLPSLRTFNQSDLAGLRGVSSTAKFGGEVANI